MSEPRASQSERPKPKSWHAHRSLAGALLQVATRETPSRHVSCWCRIDRFRSLPAFRRSSTAHEHASMSSSSAPGSQGLTAALSAHRGGEERRRHRSREGCALIDSGRRHQRPLRTMGHRSAVEGSRGARLSRDHAPGGVDADWPRSSRPTPYHARRADRVRLRVDPWLSGARADRQRMAAWRNSFEEETCRWLTRRGFDVTFLDDAACRRCRHRARGSGAIPSTQATCAGGADHRGSRGLIFEHTSADANSATRPGNGEGECVADNHVR